MLGREVPRPHPPRKYHGLGSNRFAGSQLNANRPVILNDQARHFGVFANERTALTGAFCKREGGVDGIGLAISRGIDAADRLFNV